MKPSIQIKIVGLPIITGISQVAMKAKRKRLGNKEIVALIKKEVANFIKETEATSISFSTEHATSKIAQAERSGNGVFCDWPFLDVTEINIGFEELRG